jgi:hypothetical protein
LTFEHFECGSDPLQRQIGLPERLDNRCLHETDERIRAPPWVSDIDVITGPIRTGRLPSNRRS